MFKKSVFAILTLTTLATVATPALAQDDTNATFKETFKSSTITRKGNKNVSIVFNDGRNVRLRYECAFNAYRVQSDDERGMLLIDCDSRKGKGYEIHISYNDIQPPLRRAPNATEEQREASLRGWLQIADSSNGVVEFSVTLKQQ